MGDRSSDVFGLDRVGMGVGFSRKAQKKSFDAMRESIAIMEEVQRSQMVVSEYMNMSKFIEDEAIEKFSASVVKQGESITAIANAVTSLDCKVGASELNGLNRKVSDGPTHVNHSSYYKAMDVTRPSILVLNTIRQSVSDRYIQVDLVNESNFYGILAMYDKYSSIGLDGFGCKVPEFYKFLGERFVVWDRGTEDLITIFRNLYDLRNIEDFLKYCEDRKYICLPSNGHECAVAMMTERGTARCIYPERIRDSLVKGIPEKVSLEGRLAERVCSRSDRIHERIVLSKNTTRRDRISGNVIPRPYFGEEKITGQTFEFDDVEPLPPRVAESWRDATEGMAIGVLERKFSEGLDNSYAEAMKAKRDGEIWDVRVLGDGSIVKTWHTPRPTMAEEIEQRLIDKYLT